MKEKNGIKYCPRCEKELSVDLFQKNRAMSDSLETWCKECKQNDYRSRRTRRKEQGQCHCGRPLQGYFKTCVICRKRVRRWGRENPELKKEISAKGRTHVREKIFEHYGRKCACCGNGTPEFLTVDHIEGGGNKHRKEIGGGNIFYAWLIRKGFPEGYQTLCYNCNCSKGHLGYCPHELERNSLATTDTQPRRETVNESALLSVGS